MSRSLDQLETMLLMALESAPVERGETEVARIGGASLFKSDAGVLLPFPLRTPKSAYTFELDSEDRLYTYDPTQLLRHPCEIIGEGVEFMAFNGAETLTWGGVYPMRVRPRRVAAIGKPAYWFEYHYRRGTVANGWYQSAKRVCALTKSGAPVPVKIMQSAEPPSTVDAVSTLLACSILEDAHRANAILATVSSGVEIKFPVEYAAALDLFKLRDEPRNTPTRRRNPLVHWCAKHMRARPGGGESEVRRHLRGITELSIDGITVSLSPN